MRNNFKPCPCCQGVAKKVKVGIATFKISCVICGIQTEAKFIFREDDFYSLIKIWNTRAGNEVLGE